MKHEYLYPRIAQIIPIENMYQEHSGYNGKECYIKVAALVLFEDLIDGDITQFTRYLTHNQLSHIDTTFYKGEEFHDDTWIADVHVDDISAESRRNSNLHKD